MVRSILKKSGVPKTFWLEAVAWSNHVLSMRTSNAFKRTPEEVWSGTKPVVHYFKILVVWHVQPYQTKINHTRR